MAGSTDGASTVERIRARSRMREQDEKASMKRKKAFPAQKCDLRGLAYRGY